MKWLDLAVCPKISWPSTQVEFQFEGHKILLLPRREGDAGSELAATVSVFDPAGTDFVIGGTIASRFLSRLAWSMNGGIVELWSAGSNNPARPGRLGQGTYERSGCTQVTPWDLLYFPTAASADADLALGLFREGMSVNSTPFAFLSYFKILNIMRDGGAGQKKWINDNLQYLWYQPAIDRLRILQQSESDIGQYLYEKGRCAVAHAHGTPLVNPDNYADRRRMEDDLRLMKDIAATFIERELGVLSDSSFWQGLKDGRNLEDQLLRKTENKDGEVRYVPYQ